VGGHVYKVRVPDQRFVHRFDSTNSTGTEFADWNRGTEVDQGLGNPRGLSGTQLAQWTDPLRNSLIDN
jgi:hypothetical protein